MQQDHPPANEHGIRPTRHRAMRGRGLDGHRVASQLELFFDLAFVVAVAFAARILHHDIVAGHVADGLLHFGTAFFAIWWAWMNYTWFASAYDTDDIPFRLLTMVQMIGVVVLAIGIGESGDGFGTGQVVGYCIMRSALVVQWLRASVADIDRRATCRRYALGITIMQGWWIALALAGPTGAYQLAGFAVGVAGELTVPRIAERAGGTPWHPHHIAERYGLFVIILLGEGVLGSTQALASAIEQLGWGDGLAVVAPASIGLLLAAWWAYFLAPYGDRLAQRRELGWWFGYWHYVLFGSLAATGAGLAIVAEAIAHPEEVTVVRAAASVAVPLVVFLASKFLIHARMWPGDRGYVALVVSAMVAIGGVVGAAAAGLAMQWTLVGFVAVLAGLVAATELRARRVLAPR